MVSFFKVKAHDLAGERMTGNVTHEQSFTAKFRGTGAQLATYRRCDSRTAAAVWSRQITPWRRRTRRAA